VSSARGLFTVLAIREAGEERASTHSRHAFETPPGDDRLARSVCVLVFEVRGSTRSSVVDALEANGIETITAEDGAQELRRPDSQSVDAVMLNLDLPDRSGFELLERLKALSDLPVLVVSDRAEEDDCLRALQLGADDYIMKPFSPRELAERVRAVLRRSGRETRPPRLAFDDIAIDLDARTVTVAGNVTLLTPIEFDLLVFLARRPRHVYSRAQLLREVWGSSADWQTEATVTEHVRRLRRKIEAPPGARRLIVTVQRAGYRFDP
jgi:DNA-binding response OmpR family regulator